MCQAQAEIAQSVEHFTRNEGVEGSSPFSSLWIPMLQIPMRSLKLFSLTEFYFILFSARRQGIFQNQQKKTVYPAAKPPDIPSFFILFYQCSKFRMLFRLISSVEVL